MTLATIYDFLWDDLEQIEDKLVESIEANHPILRESSLQLLHAGGKRIRPVFVLLSARFGKYSDNKKQIRAVAIAIELIHMATLVHDDVVDDAELRRGEPTIKHLYGNRVAMYTGDYLLARALEVITAVKMPEIHQLLSKTLVHVVQGEMSQLEDKFNIEQRLRNYLRRIKRKTALLIATSCKLGAIAANVSDKDANRLYQYGYNIGMSFQIIDDVLDFTASSEQLGKPTGSDLLQGNMTLPALFALEDPAIYEQIRERFLNKDDQSDERFTSLLKSICKSDAIERSYEMSNRYLAKAINAIEQLQETKAQKTLLNIAQVIGSRRS